MTRAIIGTLIIVVVFGGAGTGAVVLGMWVATLAGTPAGIVTTLLAAIVVIALGITAGEMNLKRL